MNPLLALQPRRGSREELELLRERLSSMGFRPDASRVATPPPAPFVPPTIGPRREGLPFAPERAPARGISVDFGDGRGEQALNMDMLEGMASLSSAPARGVSAAAKASLPRLSALHNTNSAMLARALDLGGMPVPSIAVVPEQVPFTDFGPITLIGRRSLGDPATSRVYSADAYTTRVPEQVFPKLTKKQAQEFWQSVTGQPGSRFGDDAFRYIEDNMPGRALDVAYRSDDLVRAYQRQAGLPEMKSRESYSRLGENFDTFAREKFQPIMQNPQVKVGRELRDWDLDNVAEAMSGKGRLTEGGFGIAPTSGEIRAAQADIFRGLEPMRQRAATDVRLDDNAYLSATDDLLREVRNLAFEISTSGPGGGRAEGFQAANSLYNKLGVVNHKIHRALGRKGDLERNLAREGVKDVPPNALESLAKALDNFKRAPVKYFEAKPQRGVRFDEFAGAAVPESTPEALVERLRNAGLEVSPYKVSGDSPLTDMREPAVDKLRRLLNDRGNQTLFSLGALGAGLGAATPRTENR